MKDDKRIVHLLNRLTLGATSALVEEVKRTDVRLAIDKDPIMLFQAARPRLELPNCLRATPHSKATLQSSSLTKKAPR